MTRTRAYCKWIFQNLKADYKVICSASVDPKPSGLSILLTFLIEQLINRHDWVAERWIHKAIPGPSYVVLSDDKSSEIKFQPSGIMANLKTSCGLIFFALDECLRVIALFLSQGLASGLASYFKGIQMFPVSQSSRSRPYTHWCVCAITLSEYTIKWLGFVAKTDVKPK